MSRSGYTDDLDDERLAYLWRAAVKSALRGRRGQAFLREMRGALDALPTKRLISNELEAGGEVCAIGAVGAQRGVPMIGIDPEDYDTIAARFGIASAMAQEIMYLNDEYANSSETPEARFARMRAWVEENLR